MASNCVLGKCNVNAPIGFKAPARPSVLWPHPVLYQPAVSTQRNFVRVNHHGRLFPLVLSVANNPKG